MQRQASPFSPATTWLTRCGAYPRFGYKWTERTAAVVATQGGGCQDYGDADWHDIYQDDSCYYKWDQDLYDMLANATSQASKHSETSTANVLTACTTLTPEKAKEIFQVAYDDDMFCGFTQIAVPFSCEKSAPPSLPHAFPSRRQLASAVHRLQRHLRQGLLRVRRQERSQRARGAIREGEPRVSQNPEPRVAARRAIGPLSSYPRMYSPGVVIELVQGIGYPFPTAATPLSSPRSLASRAASRPPSPSVSHLPPDPRP